MSSDLGLHCLPMSQEWDARFLWVKAGSVILIIRQYIALQQKEHKFGSEFYENGSNICASL